MDENFSDLEADDVFSADSSRGLDGDALSDAPASADGPNVSPESGSSDSYWEISRTPLTSLVFSMPLVLAYEGGVLLLGRGSPRNGADVWLRQMLDLLGFGSYFLLPLLTALGLVAWHHMAHDRWRFSPTVLLAMAAECLLWAFLLIGIARLQERLWPLAIAATGGILPLAAAEGPLMGLLAQFVGYCGAGLYEEVLFRLLMLPAVIWLLKKWGLAPAVACGWSVVFTSVLFSAAHYVGPLGDAFTPYSFTFRAVAGAFFSLVFLLRGFGIAAGTHAAYDVLVGAL